MAQIAEQVAAALIAGGWQQVAVSAHKSDWQKRVPGAPGGQYEERGVIANVRIDAGRWFERSDGWGRVIADVDLREFQDGAAAVAALLAKEV